MEMEMEIDYLSVGNLFIIKLLGEWRLFTWDQLSQGVLFGTRTDWYRYVKKIVYYD